MAAKFQQRHYECIADLLRRQREALPGPELGITREDKDVARAQHDTLDSITRQLAGLFQADNDRFSRDRFMTAARYQASPLQQDFESGDPERTDRVRAVSERIIAEMAADDTPHCRWHVQFHSECAECRSEREFA